MSDSGSGPDPAAVTYTMQTFIDDLRQTLSPVNIAVRVHEAEDGTRTINAWEIGTEGEVSTFAIDDVAITAGRAAMLAEAIRRSFTQPGQTRAD